MGEEVFIVAIIFGSVTAIVFLGITSSLLTTWIKNRGKHSIKEDEEFLDALREFKAKTDRRLTALEKEAGLGKQEQRQVQESRTSDRSIRIDPDKEPSTSSSEGKLKNILKE